MTAGPRLWPGIFLEASCCILPAFSVVGGKNGVVTDFCPPCGICRQVMREFSDPKTFRVYLRKSPTEFKSYTLEELLPESFGPDQLSYTSLQDEFRW